MQTTSHDFDAKICMEVNKTKGKQNDLKKKSKHSPRIIKIETFPIVFLFVDDRQLVFMQEFKIFGGADQKLEKENKNLKNNKI